MMIVYVEIKSDDNESDLSESKSYDDDGRMMVV